MERRLARQGLLVRLGQRVLQEPQELLVLRRLEQLQLVLVERPMRWRWFPNRQWFHSCYMVQLLAKQQRFLHNRNLRSELGRTLVLVHCKMLQRPSSERPS